MQQRTGASRLTVASPGGEADVLRAQLAAEGHPLLVDERLDRAGVDGAPPARERGEVQGGGDERLAGAGRRVQDDVLPLEQLEDRLLLRRVERQGPWRRRSRGSARAARRPGARRRRRGGGSGKGGGVGGREGQARRGPGAHSPTPPGSRELRPTGGARPPPQWEPPRPPKSGVPSSATWVGTRSRGCRASARRSIAVPAARLAPDLPSAASRMSGSRAWSANCVWSWSPRCITVAPPSRTSYAVA